MSDDAGPDVQAEIARLLDEGASNEDLLIILGEEDGALFASPTDKMKRGRRYLRNVIEKVHERLCSNEFARAHGENPSTQRKALAVAAVIDFLGTKGAATASVLIIQVGLENVCSGRWEQQTR